MQEAQSGDGAMRQCLFSILALVATCTDIQASCIDPSTLVRSTVSITRKFSEEEKKAVLELRSAFPNAAALPIRTEPLVPEERVVSLAYPHNHLRFAQGRFVEFGADAKFVGAALLEMHDGNDRLVLDHGASGAPV